ncbi:MAG: hypothetical protein QOG62_888 [Thermoleophilaceae bacterium]|jgi:YVTN family beta-propeller protein|nr:hypothetical protein [Thermoleophilaceae bacterium]
MGVVYRATQLGLERQVALKVIAPELAADPIFASRFQAEARLAASIDHPNVVPIYQAGEGEGVLYLIMRYVDGIDLRDLLNSQPQLDPEHAAKLLAQIASALGAAHRRGMVHRDVKPANVLIASGDGEDHAYLTDFGVAKAVEATQGMTRTGAVVGTPDYMAPERLEDGVGDGRSDIYALGCVLYQSLTGRLPYPRDNAMAKVFAHLNAPVPSARELNPFVGEELDHVIERAMAKRPEDRFQGAGEMRSALLSAVGDREGARRDPSEPHETITVATEAGAPTAETPPPLPPEPEPEPPAEPATNAVPKRPRRRGWMPAALLTVAVVGLGTLLILALTGGLSGKKGGPGAPAVADAPIKVGTAPEGVIAAGGIWVANTGSNTVTRLIPQSGAVADEAIQVGDQPTGITMGERAAWVTNRGSGDVAAIDRVTHEVTDTVPVGNDPEGITAGDGAIWVAVAGEGKVVRIDEDHPSSTTDIDVGGKPVGVAWGTGGLWVTDAKAGTLRRFNPQTQKESLSVDVGRDPRSVSLGFGSVWVASAGDGQVFRIDPISGGIQWHETVGTDLAGIGAGPGAMWTTSSAGGGQVIRIDMATGTPRVGAPIPVSPDPGGIGVGDNAAWVTSKTDGTVTPIPRQASP